MRIAKGLVDEVLSTFSRIDNEKSRLTRELQVVDIAISNIYHELELVKLGTVQAHKVMTRLQELLRQRREFKHELRVIGRLNDTIRGNKIVSKMNKAKKVSKKILVKKRH